MASIVHKRDVHAQRRTLDFTSVDGQQRIAEREAADEVRAAGDRCESRVRLQVRVVPTKQLCRERRASGENAAQAAEIVLRARRVIQFGKLGKIPGADPKVIHALFFDVTQQHTGIRMQRRAVVQAHRGAAGQRRDQPVPHHPAAGGEEQHALVIAKITVQ